MAPHIEVYDTSALEDHSKGQNCLQHVTSEALSIQFQSLIQKAHAAGARVFEPIITGPPNPLEANPFLVKVARGFKKEEVPAISLKTLAEEEISFLSESFPEANHVYTDGSVMPDSGQIQGISM